MTNWLTFSMSPLEMLKSTDEQSHFVSFNDSSSSSTPYLIDNFYVFKEEEAKVGTTSMEDSTTLATLFNLQQTHSHTQIPKLEDFLGHSSSSLVHYMSHSQTSHVLEPSTTTEPTCHTTGEALSLDVNNTKKQRLVSCINGEKGGKCVKISKKQTKEKKVSETFGKRSSIYRGVTRHRWTGRYEAHLWDNSCRREGQVRKGRQVYLGGYEKEDKAARAYDLAALKYWGPSIATTNFPIASYAIELEEMNHMTKQEFIASLRRKSSGFSRGASIYRGVTRQHQQGRWQARIGRVSGNKDLYLGTFATEEEAAEAYDIAAIKFRGINAVTNFEMNRYDVEAIMKSSLPVGGATKRHKLDLESPSSSCSENHNLQQHLVLPSSSPDLNPIESSVLYHHQNIFQHYPLVYDSTFQVAMDQAEFFLWPN